MPLLLECRPSLSKPAVFFDTKLLYISPVSPKLPCIFSVLQTSPI